MDTEKKTGELVRATHQPRMFSLLPSSLGEAMEIAQMIANSDFAPKDYKNKPHNVLIAIQMGADVGLKPMQSLQNIAVINGRPSIWGDAALALIQAADILERFHETIEGEGDKRTATCIIKRKGLPDEIKRTFSVLDAKTAKLWGKTSSTGAPTPWVTYPDRMLQMRARGFAVRDAASDRLMGLILAEEAMDYPDAIDTPVITSEPVASPLDRLSDVQREIVEKAFVALNLASGARLAKINEFLGPEADVDAGVASLIDWCRDEYARRKTGQPRKKGDEDNGKGHAKAKDPTPAKADAAHVPSGDQPVVASDGGVVGTGARDQRTETAGSKPAVQPLTSAAIPFGDQAGGLGF